MSAAEKAVEEIVITFRDFFYRDLFYVVAGVSIIGTFFFVTEKLDQLRDPNGATTFFLIVIGYVVGYAIQEAATLVKLVRTTYERPSCVIRYFGRRFAPADPWGALPEASAIDSRALRFCMDLHMPHETRKRHQRTINLKHMSASMGAAGAVSALIGFTYAVIKCREVEPFTWMLFSGIALVSAVLVVMNKIKEAQQRMLELKLNELCSNCNGSALHKQATP